MHNDIHIAALVPYPVFPAKMGGQKGIALFYTHLSRIAPVTILGTSDNVVPGDFAGEFITLLGTKRSRYYNLSLIRKLSGLISKKRITHLIAEHPYYAWLVLAVKRNTSVKLIVHSHNIESMRFRDTGKWWWGILWHYEKLLHRKADLNFFISDEDRQFAIDKFGLDSSKCTTITYGFELNHPPSDEERRLCRSQLQTEYGIGNGERIMFFNGTLSYGPNLDAINLILNSINPLLLNTGQPYKIIICGKGLPGSYDDLRNYRERNIIYAGFVEDINVYFKGADVFLNPVNGGGGIKTKLVEALGSGLTCISTQTGAIGVPKEITGGKLVITGDNDVENFARSAMNADISGKTPGSFFQYFAWENIAKKAKDAISKLA